MALERICTILAAMSDAKYRRGFEQGRDRKRWRGLTVRASVSPAIRWHVERGLF